MKNFYEALQVKNFAEDEVIKASYKALSKKYHPDVNASAPEEWMMQINEAYEVLGNPEKKKEYDQELHMHIGEDQNLRSEGDASKDFHEDIYASEIRYNSIPKKDCTCCGSNRKNSYKHRSSYYFRRYWKLYHCIDT